MRIISGECKGKKLVSLRGTATRPTADRVREAIFNILAPRIENSRVLDLFAGTGAMGLEALSRGAAGAVFVDSSVQAVATIQKNIIACRMEDRSRIFRWDITRNLLCLKTSPPFDLVFMDPPYAQNCIKPALEHLGKINALKNNATIIIEHAAAEPIPEDVVGVNVTGQRIYGKTLVSFLTIVVNKPLIETA